MLQGIKRFFIYTEEEMIGQTYDDGFRQGYLFAICVVSFFLIVIAIIN